MFLNEDIQSPSLNWVELYSSGFISIRVGREFYGVEKLNEETLKCKRPLTQLESSIGHTQAPIECFRRPFLNFFLI